MLFKMIMACLLFTSCEAKSINFIKMDLDKSLWQPLNTSLTHRISTIHDCGGLALSLDAEAFKIIHGTCEVMKSAVALMGSQVQDANIYVDPAKRFTLDATGNLVYVVLNYDNYTLSPYPFVLGEHYEACTPVVKIPRRFYFATTVVLNGLIHIFGGTGSRYSTGLGYKRIMRLETNGSWTINPGKLFRGRQKAGGIALNDDQVFLAGGQYSYNCDRSTEVYTVGDPFGVPGPELPEQTGSYMRFLVLSPKRVLIYGGRKCPQPYTFSDSTVLVDLEANTSTIVAYNTVSTSGSQGRVLPGLTWLIHPETKVKTPLMYAGEHPDSLETYMPFEFLNMDTWQWEVLSAPGLSAPSPFTRFWQLEGMETREGTLMLMDRNTKEPYFWENGKWSVMPPMDNFVKGRAVVMERDIICKM